MWHWPRPTPVPIENSIRPAVSPRYSRVTNQPTNQRYMCVLYLGRDCRYSFTVVQGKRFDPDMPQTLRLEFARSNTKVSNKPKPQHHQPHLSYQQPSLGPHHHLLQQQQQQQRQQQLTLSRTSLVHPLGARTIVFVYKLLCGPLRVAIS